MTDQKTEFVTSVNDLPNGGLSPIEEVIADARAGKMVILVDDHDRENEGDLVIPAECADAAAINFMARHGCGLICLSITEARAQRFELPPMAARNTDPMHTAFTVSVDARVGTSTGISAADRARTIDVMLSADSTAGDLVSPGHLFPLVARPGGVIERNGHTEAAIDLARLAGRGDAGVICEIMREDGEMARLPDLVPYAKKHGLKIGSIADMVAWRLENEAGIAFLDRYIPETRKIAA